MRILVACEESGVLRRALRARGHDAWSCDLMRSADNSPYHIVGDALLRIDDPHQWDAIIAFPPCTYLTNAQARWLKDHWVTCAKHPEGRYWHDGATRREAQAAAVHFVKLLWANIKECGKGAIENPRGMLSNLWRKPTQEIHPWQHGHAEEKLTALWVHGLPKLVPSNIVPPPYDQRVWRMSPGPERGRLRGHTLPGVAAAMADQWFGRCP